MSWVGSCSIQISLRQRLKGAELHISVAIRNPLSYCDLKDNSSHMMYCNDVLVAHVLSIVYCPFYPFTSPWFSSTLYHNNLELWFVLTMICNMYRLIRIVMGWRVRWTTAGPSWSFLSLDPAHRSKLQGQGQRICKIYYIPCAKQCHKYQQNF